MVMISDRYFIFVRRTRGRITEKMEDAGDETVVWEKVCYDQIGQVILRYIELFEVSGSYQCMMKHVHHTRCHSRYLLQHLKTLAQVSCSWNMSLSHLNV